MFVLGLIVGIILGIAAYAGYGLYILKKKWNLKSMDEIADTYDFLETAGNNRKCVATLWQDEDLLNTIVFDEE